MHFPWKKSKATRIARLVADLHQSPKRGGSLVVETGFPTSLVDLFVKNSYRLRKSSKKKSNSSSSPWILVPPTPPLSRSPCNEDLQSPDMDVGEVFNSTENNDDERIPFHVAFKVSLAVALAVSTRSLAIWIMTAALSLVLIKFVGTDFWGFLRPESKTHFFCSGIPKGLKLKSRADELVVKQQGTESPDPRELIELGDELKLETVTSKSKRSRSPRIKTDLIKKLVPKKLRHGTRKKQGNKEHGVGEEDESGTEQGDQLLQVESETGNIGKGNSGCVILSVIISAVLAGLIGGRGVSLLLTLVCCSILELTQRR